MLLAVFAAMFSLSTAQTKRHAPNYSLKSPFVAEDNNKWETGAGAKVDNQYVRLTPDFPSRTGYLWSRIKNTAMADWETEIEFKVTGSPNVRTQTLNL